MNGTDLRSFGFTDRHARFLATVVLHSGVFAGRQYAAFGSITHGQKVHDFRHRVPGVASCVRASLCASHVTTWITAYVPALRL